MKCQFTVSQVIALGAVLISILGSFYLVKQDIAEQSIRLTFLVAAVAEMRSEQEVLIDKFYQVELDHARFKLLCPEC